MSLFSKRKKLIVSGCSYTDNYAAQQSLGEIPLWSEVLAEKLDMDCINVGKSAAGNKAIFGTLTDRMLTEKNVGLVIPMWSEVQRVSYYSEKSSDWKSWHPEREILNADWHDKFYEDNKEQNPWGNPLKKEPRYRLSMELRKNNLDNMTAGINDSIRLYYSFQSICEASSIPYLQIQGPLPIMGKKDNKNRINFCKHIIETPYIQFMNDKKFLGWPTMPEIGGFNVDSFLDDIDKDRTKYRIDDGDTHPNAEGHSIISDILYDAYKKNYSKK